MSTEQPVRQKKKEKIIRLLERDGYVCGKHEGGCLHSLSKEEATIDHIIPKAFYLAGNEDSRSVFNLDWNLQPMHQRCNTKRDQQGFPEFTCACHWLMIEGDTLYVVTKEDRHKLWSPITTASPYTKLVPSVAKPVKGPPGLEIIHIVGGNAILMHGVYTGNVEEFNMMARTRPRDLNQYSWSPGPVKRKEPERPSGGVLIRPTRIEIKRAMYFTRGMKCDPNTGSMPMIEYSLRPGGLSYIELLPNNKEVMCLASERGAKEKFLRLLCSQSLPTTVHWNLLLKPNQDNPRKVRHYIGCSTKAVKWTNAPGSDMEDLTICIFRRRAEGIIIPTNPLPQ